MDTRENFIRLIKDLPEEKMRSVFELIADEIVSDKVSDGSVKKSSSATVDKSGYILFNYKAEKDFTVKNGDVLNLDFGKRSVEVRIEEGTIIPRSFFLAGDELCVLGQITGNNCIAKAVTTKEFYEMFDSFGAFDKKLSSIKQFLVLPEKAQSEIRNQLSGIRYPLTRASTVKTKGVGFLKLKFELCRSAFTPQQQMDIESIFEELGRLTASNKTRAERRLEYILNVVQSFAEDITLTKEEIIAELDKHLYKLDKVKEKIAEAVIAAKYSDRKGFALLLVGSPGVGKTSIMKAVAKALGRKCFVIPLGSSTSIIDILGDSPSYDASDSGEVVKAFYKAGTTAIVMGLDEYDKAYSSAKEGGNISKAFNDALSDEHFFKDAFLGTYINTSNTIFIATANSTESIPENLLNRFTVIHVDDYTEEEKTEIASKYILPEILNEHGIKDEVTVSAEVIRYIADNFCEDEGARDLKKNLETVVGKILSEWDTAGERSPFDVDIDFVDRSLECYVNKNSPAIIYRRNKHLYTPQISTEIKELIVKLRRSDIEPQLREKYEKKLDYLVHMIPSGNAFESFDKDFFFETVNKSHFGLENVKKEIAQVFNVSAMNGNSLTSNRILLVSSPGNGKTSLVGSIAKGCNSDYVKISLNGVSDETVIKGSPEAYVGAGPGAVCKALRKIGTRGIILLDEIDKMGSSHGVNAASALVDLLDDSAEFTDNFLSVPVDLSNILFIATANDISAVDKVILDRFTVIFIDGYTEKEKGRIISDYVIPKVIAELCSDKVKMEFSNEARALLTEAYCRSFGVRDADRAVRRIVRDMLFSIGKDETQVLISSDDVKRVLGKPMAERGNFPDEVYPGLSKALAVTGDNCGMAFAVETVLIPDDDSFTITGLPMESTVDSVKLAKSYIKRNYPGKLNNKGIHVHFGEGSVKKDGPSAGVAILMSMLSATFDKPITENVAYTGEINANGNVFNIGGTKSKIQAAEQSGCTRVFVPYGNYMELDESDLEQFSIEIVPVKHSSEVIKEVFPEL